jgi:hypothetical protein
MPHYYNYKRYSVIYLFVLVTLLLVSKTNAQELKSNSVKLTSDFISNINNGIMSDNPGLRQSAIHLAGKYQIQKLSESLLHQIKTEKENKIKIEIVKSLYMIGNDEFFDEIFMVASKDNDLGVREFASSLCTLMRLENSINVTEIN